MLGMRMVEGSFSEAMSRSDFYLCLNVYTHPLSRVFFLSVLDMPYTSEKSRRDKRVVTKENRQNFSNH